MSQSPSISPVIATGWPDLVEELDCWREAGRSATLWWRDDDAVRPTRGLELLASIAGGVPLALAVIPATAQTELAIWLSDRAQSVARTRVTVLQHGWSHSNHSVGTKKSEFPAERPSREVSRELDAGRARLTEIFGARALPVFVPPWNRFDDRFMPLLSRCGLSGISRVKPRCAIEPVPGVVEANVHVDLVAWAQNREFIGEEVALSGLVGHLRARRLGLAFTDEPTGILTHHLVHGEPTEAFLHQLFEITGAHPAALWLEGPEIFVSANPIRA